MQLDLFFTEHIPATETTASAAKGKNSDSSFSSDDNPDPETSHPRERQSPRTKESAVSKEDKMLLDLQKKSENDNFWLTLSSQIIRN